MHIFRSLTSRNQSPQALCIFLKAASVLFWVLITPIYLFAFCILAQKSNTKYQRWKSLRFSAGAFQKPELHSSHRDPHWEYYCQTPPKLPATVNGSLQLSPCFLVSSIHPSEKGDENGKERDSAIPRNSQCSFPLHIPPLGTTGRTPVPISSIPRREVQKTCTLGPPIHGHVGRHRAENSGWEMPGQCSSISTHNSTRGLHHGPSCTSPAEQRRSRRARASRMRPMCTSPYPLLTEPLKSVKTTASSELTPPMPSNPSRFTSPAHLQRVLWPSLPCQTAPEQQSFPSLWPRDLSGTTGGERV